MLYECVVNISEGREPAALSALDRAAGPLWRDRQSDAHHHRSVLTLVGPAPDLVEAVQAVATTAVRLVDLRTHRGAHPRLGVLDVVPFVPYDPGRLPPQDLREAMTLRDEFARWLADELAVPAFLYGPLPGGQSRTLPQVRKEAFGSLAPDLGPPSPHPTAGASAVGARAVLVAYNLWVSPLEVAQRVAPLVRGPSVRALGLAVGDRAQVSCNLIAPEVFGPDRLYDQVAGLVVEAGGRLMGAELVGLIPAAVLERIPPERWAELGLAENLTIESRLPEGPGHA